ncbi:hypothetical protein C8J57DRAFT_1307636 [Mycena rebaudengoi]|nr:hypothetical protein C8J57DRAFT_1307636 [Mycena rebaudengoi]
MSRYVHGRMTKLAFHFVFHWYCLYLPAGCINTSSMPPCATRVIVGCSWLSLAVLELFTVVGRGWAVRRLFFDFPLSPLSLL